MYNKNNYYIIIIIMTFFPTTFLEIAVKSSLIQNIVPAKHPRKI